jgi:predicted nucleic acid-binding protein
MTTYCADSSALVKRYAEETGSQWVQSICEPDSGHVIALAQIGLVEIAAALGMKHRLGELPASDRDDLLRDLQRDGRTLYWLIDVDPDVIVRAIELTRRHKLRGYDAVHLACALFVKDILPSRGLPEPVLLASDNDLLTAAQNEGMLTDNPGSHP